MQQPPINTFSKGFLSLVAILLTFVLLLAAIWLWYDLRLASLDQDRKEKEKPSSQINP
jgi:cytoskeletal protein RodZ